MRILKFTFALLFVALINMSFAQEQPYLVIEDNNGHYDVYLKIDNMKDLTSVDIIGAYSSDGATSSLSINIDEEEIAELKDKLALIHSLTQEVNESTASYTVLLTSKSGELTSYPMVTVNLGSHLQLAANF